MNGDNLLFEPSDSHVVSRNIAQARTADFRPVQDSIALQNLLRTSLQRLHEDVQKADLRAKDALAIEYIQTHSLTIVAEHRRPNYHLLAADIDVGRNSAESRCIWMVLSASEVDVEDMVGFAERCAAKTVLVLSLLNSVELEWIHNPRLTTYTVEELPQALLSQVTIARFWDVFVDEYFYSIKHDASGIRQVLQEFGLTSDVLFADLRRIAR